MLFLYRSILLVVQYCDLFIRISCQNKQHQHCRHLQMGSFSVNNPKLSKLGTFKGITCLHAHSKHWHWLVIDYLLQNFQGFSYSSSLRNIHATLWLHTTLTQDVPHIVECIFSPSPHPLHAGATGPRSICCTKIQKIFYNKFVCVGRVPDPTSHFPPDLILYVKFSCHGDNLSVLRPGSPSITVLVFPDFADAYSRTTGSYRLSQLSGHIPESSQFFGCQSPQVWATLAHFCKYHSSPASYEFY